jgi:hypothetical protein
VNLMPDAASSNSARDRRWLILGVIGLAQVMVIMSLTVMNIALLSAQCGIGRWVSGGLLREVMPSLVNTLPKCHSTVRGLMYRWAAISWLKVRRTPPAITAGLAGPLADLERVRRLTELSGSPRGHGRLPPHGR